MRYLLFLLLLLTGGLLPGGAAHGQAPQLLCERGLGAYQPAVPYSGLYAGGLLTATAPDSCLLYVRQPPGTDVFDPLTRARLVWLTRAGCDTAGFASFPTGRTGAQVPVLVARRRRGDLLVASTRVRQTSAATDSSRVELRSYSRRGTLRWARTYPAASQGDQACALLESPDRGAYFSSRTSIVPSTMIYCQLTKVDSVGRLLWRRRYCPGAVFDYADANYRLTYTIRGNLLVSGHYSAQNQPNCGLVLEVSQRGDSLTSRVLRAPYPGRHLTMLGLCPLRDGGFLVTATLDTTLNGLPRYLPYLLRLDANLSPRWGYVHRAQPGSYLSDLSRGGYELADGSLLVAYHNDDGRNLRLLHLAPTGALLTSYTYQSAHPVQGGIRAALTPLAADSSFVLAGSFTAPYGTYVERFRLPGLRRVLAEPGIPAAQVLAARAPLAAFPAPAYPNPAREAVTVPLPAGPGTLRLRDLTGRLVRELATPVGDRQVSLPLASLAQGVYLLSFERAGQPPAVQRLAVGW